MYNYKRGFSRRRGFSQVVAFRKAFGLLILFLERLVGKKRGGY